MAELGLSNIDGYGAINTDISQDQTLKTDYSAAGGSAMAIGANGLSQSLATGEGANLTVRQSTPGAIGAMYQASENAITQAGQTANAALSSATRATQSALDTAKGALTPESAQSAKVITVLIVAIAAVAAFKLYRG